MSVADLEGTVPLKRNVASARARKIANKRGVAHEQNAGHAPLKLLLEKGQTAKLIRPPKQQV